MFHSIPLRRGKGKPFLPPQIAKGKNAPFALFVAAIGCNPVSWRILPVVKRRPNLLSGFHNPNKLAAAPIVLDHLLPVIDTADFVP